jgi:putative transposase
MPRAKRYLQEGHTYHLTHRCHDRRFLLRFARDREAFREWLRRGVRRYHVPLFAYCVTSNHIHLVVRVDDREAVGRMMNLVAGATARQFNRRKQRSGAFWEDTYHCTAVEDGRHLWRCLRYIDLNMVRAGVVKHPEEWRWCGYDELVGRRARYRLLHTERLADILGCPEASFREAYADGIRTALQADLTRQAEWAESLAVGSSKFVERIASVSGRREVTYDQVSRQADDTWCVREACAPLHRRMSPKKAS